MKTVPQRVCIYPKDIQLITGRSYRYARELLADIKRHLHKNEHQFISVEEFCTYTGLNTDEVKPLIIG